MKDIERDRKLDIMRCIALLGIIVAHVNPSDFIAQLRSFDVPMMAFLCGASYYLCNQREVVKYKDYVNKRFRKLVVPTWIFLSFFFIATYILSILRHEIYYYDLQKIIDSYTLIGGIGYVWIVWIFFVIALCCPFMYKLCSRVSDSVYLMILTICYFLYMIVVHYYKILLSGNLLVYVEHYIIYAIGYILVAALGIRLYKCKRATLVAMSIFFVGLYLVIAINKDFELTGHYKYPTQTYYLAYALAIILLMWLILQNKPIYTFLNRKPIWFVSENSFWIYLWHIVPLNIMNIFKLSGVGIFKYVTGRFLFVFVFAVVLVCVQNEIKHKIKDKRINII